MKKILSRVLLTSLLFTGLIYAYGNERAPVIDSDFGKGGCNPMLIFNQLGLTEMQKKEIDTIWDVVTSDKNYDARSKMHNFKKKKRFALIRSKILDMNAIEKLADAQAQKIKDEFINKVVAKHKMWELLTPKQQAKASMLIEQREERMRKRSESSAGDKKEYAASKFTLP